MNGTTVEKEWKSKTDKELRYEQCIKCGTMVLDNWYLRHVKKCVQDHPNAKKLFEEASEIHKNYILKNEAAKEAAKETKKEEIKEVPKNYSPEIDNKLVETTPTNQRLLNNFHKYTFKFGDMVDAVVTSVESYGVFVNNIQGNIDKQGLIKISKARNTPVHDLNAHFRVGDKIRAEVVEVRVDGKLGLSTKKSVLPTYHVSTFKNAFAEKLEPLKEQIMVQNNEVKKPDDVHDDKQLEEIITFVRNKIGLVSPEARLKIKELLDTNGMFTFMMALAKVADIQLDVGLLFAQEIEKKMGNRP